MQCRIKGGLVVFIKKLVKRLGLKEVKEGVGLAKKKSLRRVCLGFALLALLLLA